MDACVGAVCTEGQVGQGFDATGTAVLQRVSVNGEGCGPIAYQASVVAGPDGTLSAG